MNNLKRFYYLRCTNFFKDVTVLEKHKIMILDILEYYKLLGTRFLGKKRFFKDFLLDSDFIFPITIKNVNEYEIEIKDSSENPITCIVTFVFGHIYYNISYNDELITLNYSFYTTVHNGLYEITIKNSSINLSCSILNYSILCSNFKIIIEHKENVYDIKIFDSCDIYNLIQFIYKVAVFSKKFTDENLFTNNLEIALSRSIFKNQYQLTTSKNRNIH